MLESLRGITFSSAPSGEKIADKDCSCDAQERFLKKCVCMDQNSSSFAGVFESNCLLIALNCASKLHP